eukprot:1288724-Prymnesium_polylepis.1
MLETSGQPPACTTTYLPTYLPNYGCDPPILKDITHVAASDAKHAAARHLAMHWATPVVLPAAPPPA